MFEKYKQKIVNFLSLNKEDSLENKVKPYNLESWEVEPNPKPWEKITATSKELYKKAESELLEYKGLVEEEKRLYENYEDVYSSKEINTKVKASELERIAKGIALNDKELRNTFESLNDYLTTLRKSVQEDLKTPFTTEEEIPSITEEVKLKRQKSAEFQKHILNIRNLRNDGSRLDGSIFLNAYKELENEKVLPSTWTLLFDEELSNKMIDAFIKLKEKTYRKKKNSELEKTNGVAYV